MAIRSVRLATAAALALGVGIVGPAAFAASFPVTGTFSLTIATLAPITIAASGTVVANGSGGGVHLTTLAVPSGLLGTTGLIVPITDPAASPIKGIQLTVANSPGTIVGGNGAIPLNGTSKLCLFAPCASPIANLTVPLSVVGNGGVAFVTGVVNLTVVGAPWTTGTAAVGALTQMGFARGPASLASSTAQASGAIQLVTPVVILNNLGPATTIPAFATLTLHFVPEPTTLALLGGGIAFLAGAGHARRHAMR